MFQSAELRLDINIEHDRINEHGMHKNTNTFGVYKLFKVLYPMQWDIYLWHACMLMPDE